MSEIGRESAAGRRTWRLPRFDAARIGAALLAATVLVSAPFVTPVAAQQQQRQGTVTTDELVANPGQYYGRRVTISGSVGQVLGPRSFALMDDDLVFGDDVVVVARRPITDQLGRQVDLRQWAGRDVRVTGTVHQFNLRAFEDRLGVDLDDDALADYAGDPALIATSIVPTQSRAAGPVAGPEAGAAATQRGQDRQGQIQQGQIQQRGDVTIDEILDNPLQNYGRRVTISGTIDEVLGPRSFTVTDEDLIFGEDIPVVSAQQVTDRLGRLAELSEWADRDVRVTGTVHQFNLAAFEDRLGLDLDDNAWAGYAGRPAIVASSVELTMASQRAEGPSRTEQGATVDAILGSPRQYYGRRVAVTGVMGGVLGPRSFTLTDDEVLSDQEVPVIAPQMMDASGRPVELSRWTTGELRVTGTVHQFNLAAFEDRLVLDLDDDAWAEYAGHPVIIASSVAEADNPGQQGR